MDAAALVTGKVYFAICYEDEELTRMIIQSYEYVGPAADDERPDGPWYRFRALDPFGDPEDDQRKLEGSPYDGEFRLNTKNILSLMDVDGLIDGLQRIKRNGPGRMWADAS